MFVKEFELKVLEQQSLLALDVVLKVTPTIWWDAHTEGRNNWSQCRRLMQVDGSMDFSARNEWMKNFIHTLETLPNNWYLELEMCRETTRWEYLV
jgi:hypothetical protein